MLTKTRVTMVMKVTMMMTAMKVWIHENIDGHNNNHDGDDDHDYYYYY